MPSHPTIPTFGGQVTRGETFAKILHHIDELRDLCLVMSHLHRAEDGQKDELMATGWRAVEQMLKATRYNMVKLAQGNIQ